MSVFIHPLKNSQEATQARLLLCQMMLALKPNDRDNQQFVHIIATPNVYSKSVVAGHAGIDAAVLGVCNEQFIGDNFSSTIPQGAQLIRATVGSIKSSCPGATRAFMPTPSDDVSLKDLNIFFGNYSHRNGAQVVLCKTDNPPGDDDDDGADGGSAADDGGADDGADESLPVFWPGCSPKDLKHDIRLSILENGRGPPGFARKMLYYILNLDVYKGRIGVNSILQIEASGEIAGSSRLLVEMYERMGFRPICASRQSKEAYDSGAEMCSDEVVMSVQVGPLLQHLKNKYNL